MTHAPIDIGALSPVPGERHLLAEGPRWSEPGTLSWVDIPEGRITVVDTATGATAHHRLGSAVGCAVACAPPLGGMLLGMGPGARLVHLAHDGTLTELATPSGGADKRMNDGTCDPAGRFWSGGISGKPHGASLYRVDLDGHAERMLSGLDVSNGIGFSPDASTMYHTDSGPRRIYAYDYDLDTGDLGSRRVLIELPDGGGRPDGLTVDDDGCLWVALWDGAAIIRIDSKGRIIQRLTLPVSRPTSCCIGGGMLWITTASLGLTDRLTDQPWSGQILRASIGVTAPPASPFRGRLVAQPGAP